VPTSPQHQVDFNGDGKRDFVVQRNNGGGRERLPGAGFEERRVQRSVRTAGRLPGGEL
jgi:hypothetical protein